MTTRKKAMTYQEAAAQSGTPPTLAHLQANFARIAAEVEAEAGPQVPALLQSRGRPRKGVKTEATATHSLRVPDALWAILEAKAKRTGISLNQAANLAILEWASRS